jgi:SAM-dependent methyltransferase
MPLTEPETIQLPHLADRPTGGLLERFLSKQRAGMASRLIPPAHRRGRILDIGCGEYPYFLLNIDFAEKFGVDRLTTSEQIRTDQNSIQLFPYDVETENVIPFENNYFDVVTMLAVFEHIDPVRLPRVLNEIHRVLKQGGMFIMTTPAVWTEGLLRWMAKLKLVSSFLIAEHKDAYSHKMIKSILKQTHFSSAQLSFGYFEFFMNNWATAVK